ncbi:hypothetical protein KI688_009501 [Linnemannia hyalina]|uniref:Amino acid transporter n=1 Tax=Linnemannia hyalina TaxID=64524 RepID=A0A9P7Y2A4_9FUNG|nr:hypothetical protein KI688_009501 [Linnemannia hyalina]
MTPNNDQPVLYSDEQNRGKVATAFAPVTNAFRLVRKHTNLTIWIVVAMVIGIIVGKFAPEFAVQIKPMGDVFVRLIGNVVGPLIFSTLVVGIAGHGSDMARVGRLAFKSIVYFEIVTTFALLIGLLAVNIAKPGSGFVGQSIDPPSDLPTKEITWITEMESIVPLTFFLAMSDHTAVLAIVFCAAMFSVAIMKADEESKRVMIAFNSSLSLIMFKVVELIMNYAPIGIGCAIAATVGKYGLGVLIVTGKLVGTLYATLIIFVLLVLLPILLIARIPLVQFIRAVGPPFLMAFATASSESALPKAMENMVAFGCPPEIVAFVIPTGYSFNLDGSTLYLALASMFCAQVAGVTKTVGEQIVMMLTLMLSSKGVAAVPRASFIVLIATLGNANIPLYPLSLIMGVDAFMDMARTSINVLGNMTACCIVAKWEGAFRDEAWQARQNGELLDGPTMQEVDVEQFSQIQHHGNDHTLGGFHAEKASIHSNSSAVETHSGSSAQQRHHNGDQIV